MAENTQLMFEVLATVRDQATAGLQALRNVIDLSSGSMRALGREADQAGSAVDRNVERMRRSIGSLDFGNVTRQLTTMRTDFGRFTDMVRSDAAQLQRIFDQLRLPQLEAQKGLGEAIARSRELSALTAQRVQLEKQITEAQKQQAETQTRLVELLRHPRYRDPQTGQFVAATFPGAQRVVPAEVELRLRELEMRERAIRQAQVGIAQMGLPSLQAQLPQLTPLTMTGTAGPAQYLGFGATGPLALHPSLRNLPVSRAGLMTGGAEGIVPPTGPGGAGPGTPGFTGGALRTALTLGTRSLTPALAQLAPELAYSASYLSAVARTGSVVGGIGGTTLAAGAVGVGVAALAFVQYAQALEEAATKQTALNVATKNFDLGGLRSMLSEGERQLEHFASRSETFVGRVRNAIERGWDRLFGTDVESQMARIAERIALVQGRFEGPRQALAGQIAGLQGLQGVAGFTRGFISTPGQAAAFAGAEGRLIDALTSAQARQLQLNVEQENARRQQEIIRLEEVRRSFVERAEDARRRAAMPQTVLAGRAGVILEEARGFEAQAQQVEAGIAANRQAISAAETAAQEQIRALTLQAAFRKDETSTTLALQASQQAIAAMEREFQLRSQMLELRKQEMSLIPAIGRTEHDFIRESLELQRQEIPLRQQNIRIIEEQITALERLSPAAHSVEALQAEVARRRELVESLRGSETPEDAQRLQAAQAELSIAQSALQILETQGPAALRQHLAGLQQRAGMERLAVRGLQIATGPEAEARLGLQADLRALEREMQVRTAILDITRQIATAGQSGIMLAQTEVDLGEQQLDLLRDQLLAFEKIIDARRRAGAFSGAEGLQEAQQAAMQLVRMLQGETQAILTQWQREMALPLTRFDAAQRALGVSDTIGGLRATLAGSAVNVPSVRTDLMGAPVLSDVLALSQSIPFDLQSRGLSYQDLLQTQANLARERAQAAYGLELEFRNIAENLGTGEGATETARQRLLGLQERLGTLAELNPNLAAAVHTQVRGALDALDKFGFSGEKANEIMRRLAEGGLAAVLERVRRTGEVAASNLEIFQAQVAALEAAKQIGEARLATRGEQLAFAYDQGLVSTDQAQAERIRMQVESLRLQQEQIAGLRSALGDLASKSTGKMEETREIERRALALANAEENAKRLGVSIDRLRFAELQRTNPFEGIAAGLRDLERQSESWGDNMRSMVGRLGNDLANIWGETFVAAVTRDFKTLEQLPAQLGRAFLREVGMMFGRALVGNLSGLLQNLFRGSGGFFSGGGAGLAGAAAQGGGGGGDVLTSLFQQLLGGYSSSVTRPVSAPVLSQNAPAMPNAINISAAPASQVAALQAQGYSIITNTEGTYAVPGGGTAAAVPGSGAIASGQVVPNAGARVAGYSAPVSYGALGGLQEFMRSPVFQQTAVVDPQTAYMAAYNNAIWAGATETEALMAAQQAAVAAEQAAATAGATGGAFGLRSDLTVGQVAGAGLAAAGFALQLYSTLSNPYYQPTTESVIGGALQGAAYGYQIGSLFAGYGGVIGAVIGAIVGGVTAGIEGSKVNDAKRRNRRRRNAGRVAEAIAKAIDNGIDYADIAAQSVPGGWSVGGILLEIAMANQAGGFQPYWPPAEVAKRAMAILQGLGVQPARYNEGSHHNGANNSIRELVHNMGEPEDDSPDADTKPGTGEKVAEALLEAFVAKASRILVGMDEAIDFGSGVGQATLADGRVVGSGRYATRTTLVTTDRYMELAGADLFLLANQIDSLTDDQVARLLQRLAKVDKDRDIRIIRLEEDFGAFVSIEAGSSFTGGGGTTTPSPSPAGTGPAPTQSSITLHDSSTTQGVNPSTFGSLTRLDPSDVPAGVNPGTLA